MRLPNDFGIDFGIDFGVDFGVDFGGVRVGVGTWRLNSRSRVGACIFLCFVQRPEGVMTAQSVVRRGMTLPNDFGVDFGDDFGDDFGR
jgi:hypothetical protein